MVTGHLALQGIRCSVKRIGSSVRRVTPEYHARKVSNTHKQTLFLTLLTTLDGKSKMKNSLCLESLMNSRVNYSVKTALVEMLEASDICNED